MLQSKDEMSKKSLGSRQPSLCLEIFGWTAPGSEGSDGDEGFMKKSGGCHWEHC